LEAFAGCFSDLADPREDNTRHDLHEILLIALCARLCGGEDCSDMALFGRSKEVFLRQVLKLKHGVPSFFLQFINNFTAGLAGVVAVDGKTLRRSFDRASAKSPLHLVSAWACEERLFLGQIAVDGKSNEITALPKLLELLPLKGRAITADAMHCQRATCAAIVAQGGGYIIAFKGNQGALHDDDRRPPQRHRPRALVHRERPALGARRHNEGGCQPQPQRPWPAKPRPAPKDGPDLRTAGGIKTLHKGKTQTRRPGRCFPDSHPQGRQC
jgi:hypothetical protein